MKHIKSVETKHYKHLELLEHIIMFLSKAGINAASAMSYFKANDAFHEFPVLTCFRKLL